MSLQDNNEIGSQEQGANGNRQSKYSTKITGTHKGIPRISLQGN